MMLSDLRSDLYARLGFADPPADTAVTTRLTRLLNQAQRRVIFAKGAGKLRRQVLQFTSNTTTPFAVLPQAAVRLITVQDRTNRRILDEMSVQLLRASDPGLVFQTSFPYAYWIMNASSPLALDPSVADKLFVVSDQAGDTTQKVYVEGMLSSGVFLKANVTLNGLTAVQVGTTSVWQTITKAFVDPAPTGNLTFTQTSGAGTILGQIPLGRTIGRYTRIQLYPSPTTSLTYFTDAELRIEDMSVASDEPYLPEDFHPMLVSRALMFEYERREKTVLFQEAKSEYKDYLTELSLWLSKKSGIVSRLRGPQWSQLGPNFPAGS